MFMIAFMIHKFKKDFPKLKKNQLILIADNLTNL